MIVHILINIMKAVIIARKAENNASLKIIIAICFSVIGPVARIRRRSVTGASLSVVAMSLKSGVIVVGFLICLCSTMRLTLDKNKKELITAGKSAIAATISALPRIAITPYIAPRVKAPESPGNILLGNLWY